MRCILLGLAIAVCLPSAPARAESWLSRMGELLETAPRIEIIHVDKIQGTTIDGHLVGAVRTPTTLGGAIAIDLAGLVTPAIGDDVLVICDSMCPRAAAIDGRGAFMLHARELSSGASVMPNIVERASLPLLAARKPAPDLCIKGTVDLVDDTAKPAFRVTVKATDGSGSGTLDGKPIRAVLGAPFDDSGLSLALGNVNFTASHPSRDADGCFVASLLPSYPMPRTRAKLAVAVVHREIGTSKVARGTLDIAKGTPVAAGRHAIELSINEDGQLMLTSDLAAGHLVETNTAHGHVSFAFSAVNDYYPLLVLDLGVQPGATTAASIVAILAHDPELAADAFWVTIKGPTEVRRRLGNVRLHYVPEP